MPTVQSKHLSQFQELLMKNTRNKVTKTYSSHSR